MIDNITLVIFVMSNVGLVVSVEFDSSGNDWKLDELALYKAFSQKNGHIWWPSNNSHHHRFCAMLRNANGRQFNFPGYQSPPVELDGWLVDCKRWSCLTCTSFGDCVLSTCHSCRCMRSNPLNVSLDFGWVFSESKLEKEWRIEIVAKHRMPVEVRLFISWNSDHLQIEISLQFLQLMSQCCLKDICLNNDVLTRGGRTLKCSILRDQLL